MKPSKSPWYPWFPRDFYADEPVMLMTLEQEGAYRRLLDHQWLHGSIPADLGQLAVICKAITAARMRAVWSGVSCCFETASESGRLVNKRLERVRQEAEAHRDRQSQNGSKGAQKRWQKDSDPNGVAMISPMAKNSSAPAPALPHNNTPTRAAVRDALPESSHDALDRLMRSSGNPEGIVDELARLLAVHPNVIPTGSGMRGESPEIVGTCLVELANSNRPEWNVAFFKGMIRRVKGRPSDPAAKESPAEKVLRMAAAQDAAA